MDRLTGCILFLVLQFYVTVNAGQIQRGRRSVEDCDCGLTPDEADSYYIEGSATAERGTRFPWMVAIKNKGQVACSGAFITRSFVITAGHCVQGEPVADNQGCKAPLKEVAPGRCLNLKDFELGFINRDAVLKKFYDVRDVILHPEFEIVQGDNGEYTKNDLALLKMKGAVMCEDYRKPLCLPFDGFYATAGRRAVIAGWGITDPPGSNNPEKSKNPKLTYGMLTVQEQSECVASLGDVKDDASFCAKGSVSACKGDSGAPLITHGDDGRFYILGVTSHLAAPGCDLEKPQFFANVKADLKWIMDIVMCCP